jgi:Ca-activated chloride channel family protein
VSFAAPTFLLGLLAVPAAIALYLLHRRRARRYAVRFTGVPILAAVADRGSRLRRHVPAALFLLALAALAVALARPQTTVAVPERQASVILVTDASRSMRAKDVDPSRLEAAQRAGERFLDRVPSAVRVGLVGYSESPHTLESPTDDHGEVRDALDGLAADGGTATGDALTAALAMLDRKDSGKRRPPAAIVLLSDGKSTTGRDPIEVARIAGHRKVPVYTVALGTPEGVIPSSPFGGALPVPPDPESLRQIAKASGGRAFTVDQSRELNTVYERLGSRIGVHKQKREVTAGFAAGGIALLLAAAGLGVRRTGRLP